MIRQKLKASLIHLVISASVIGCFLIFALTVWYPQPFFDISGLQHIILLLISVDVILGPLLTLVVFKPKKSTLKLDLSVIAIIQIIALGYGMYTIYAAHPLYVAYAIDRFTPINTNEVSPAKAKYAELQKSKFSGPTLVYVKKPSDPAEMSRVTLEVLSGKPDLDARPEYYEPFNKFVQTVITQGLDPKQLFISPQEKEKLADFLHEHGKTMDGYAFFALSGKEKDVVWAFNRTTAQPAGVLDVNPWKTTAKVASVN
ncbi:TfpX/TfpZ family type IV pilin accessory protein [Candidatus Thiothrix sp. Deng01]|uniref:TfpX/TfpZ family type IV pilin accessory protein n=1 Tax=Candidatus Thiothrix phosphatis TaxID=3112415 RepID=A0ABU6D3Y6_9GAMM|nr:TfpX/TfpZ family type IV pilin accessory protein [Candidatus Thiothrix sp. Deng01]MEB4593393.1 TfpX/TfpZ family type IV pilin accessory protein [Candidatus Thiothrix sp. Deng01]